MRAHAGRSEFLRFSKSDKVGDPDAAKRLRQIIDDVGLYFDEIPEGERKKSAMSAEARAYCDKIKFTDLEKDAAVHSPSLRSAEPSMLMPVAQACGTRSTISVGSARN